MNVIHYLLSNQLVLLQDLNYLCANFILGNCQCGGPYGQTGRIINGFEVAPHSLPYQVYVLTTRSTGNYFCGGSLISPNFVLTAAHCAETALSIRITVGEHNLVVVDGEQYISVSNITVHPLWNTNTLAYDYAILKLSTPVFFSAINPFVGYVCLPPDVTQTFAAEQLTTSGWGRTIGDTPSSVSNVLKAAILRGMSNQECSTARGQALANFPPDLLCAKGFETNSSTCFGDSGGNIFIRKFF